MAERIGDVVFRVDQSDNDSDMWDDSALIKAYDKAISDVKGMTQEDSPSSGHKKSGKNRGKKKRGGKKKNKRSSQWKVGDYCKAMFTEDDQIYRAVVKAVDLQKGSCRIKYIGYGNEEEKRVSDLLTESEAEMPSKMRRALENGYDSMEWTDHSQSPMHPTSSSHQTGPRRRPVPPHHPPHGAPPPPPPPGYPNPYGPWYPPCGSHHAHIPPPPPPPPPPAPFMPPMSYGHWGASRQSVYSHPFPPWGSAPNPGHTPPRIPSFPPPAPPHPPLPEGSNEMDDEALHSMLMSWYMSGYHTGYYQGLQQSRSRPSGSGPSGNSPSSRQESVPAQESHAAQTDRNVTTKIKSQESQTTKPAETTLRAEPNEEQSKET